MYRSAASEGKWQCVVEDGDLDEVLAQHEDWQGVAGELMWHYAERTNGSFVWRSPSTVSWSFVLADPELGAMQASRSDPLSDYPTPHVALSSCLPSSSSSTAVVSLILSLPRPPLRAASTSISTTKNWSHLSRLSGV